MKTQVSPSDLGGKIAAPASKSSMQRAVACAGLAPGRSLLRNPGFSADCLAALALIETLGARVERGAEAVVIDGGILKGPLRAGTRRLSCGESGLCIRMFTPIVALFPEESILEAEGSLRSRPVSMVEGVLEALGASCSTTEGLPPIRIRGPLHGGRVRTDARSSSQFVTGLLIALPLAEEDSTLEAEGLVSSGYVDLTLATMCAFGVEARRLDGTAAGSAAGLAAFGIAGGQRYRPADFEVEGDWSGAAFLLVAGAIAARREPLQVTGLSLDSAQPDRAVLAALESAGAGLEKGRGRICIHHGTLRAFTFDATGCPDLFPPLVALASACEGVSAIRGVGRLRNKESDRALALSEEFAALGVPVSIEGDVMLVTGARGFGGGRVDSRGDHRIAMAAAVSALAATGSIDILGAECVAKSWPSFFEDLALLRRPLR